MYISEAMSGYALRLVEDGVFRRQVDLLLLGFGYAVQKSLVPPDRIKRHELLKVAGITDDVRLAIEAVGTWYARELKQDLAGDPRALLEFICRVGSAGVEALKQEWDGKAKSQIELSILRLGSTRRAPSAPDNAVSGASPVSE